MPKLQPRQQVIDLTSFSSCMMRWGADSLARPVTRTPNFDGLASEGKTIHRLPCAVSRVRQIGLQHAYRLANQRPFSPKPLLSVAAGGAENFP
jgi:hypothetical protein